MTTTNLSGKISNANSVPFIEPIHLVSLQEFKGNYDVQFCTGFRTLFDVIFTAKECIQRVRKALQNNPEDISLITGTQHDDGSKRRYLNPKIKCPIVGTEVFDEFNQRNKFLNISLDIGIITVTVLTSNI